MFEMGDLSVFVGLLHISADEDYCAANKYDTASDPRFPRTLGAAREGVMPKTVALQEKR